MSEHETTENKGYHVLLAGVDTLVLNVRYADENDRPVKQELTDEFVEQFDLWQKEARQEEESVPTPLVFAGETLLIYPHGAGKGQWKWLLTCRAFTLALGCGRLNGIIAQVRFSSEYLWSCQDDGKQDIAVAMVGVFTFLHDLFGLVLHFQVSEVHLCADMIGWDVSSCEWQETFLSRARRRVDRAVVPAETVSAGGAAVAVISGRRLATLEFGSHGSPNNDPLHRFGHIKPGTSTGRVQEPNAVFPTPTHEIATVMACQIVQNEQHAQGRIHPVQLLCRWKGIPILPSPPFWNQLWSGWAPLENGYQFAFEPGMQDSIRTLIDRLSTQFTAGRPKQRQEFARLAANILVILGCRLALQLKTIARMRNGLIGTRFIFTPQRQTHSLCQHIRTLNHGFFSCVEGSSLW